MVHVYTRARGVGAVSCQVCIAILRLVAVVDHPAGAAAALDCVVAVGRFFSVWAPMRTANPLAHARAHVSGFVCSGDSLTDGPLRFHVFVSW